MSGYRIHAMPCPGSILGQHGGEYIPFVIHRKAWNSTRSIPCFTAHRISRMVHPIPMPWTADQVLALAPDASSAKSGRDLAAPRHWLSLGTDGACAWGTLQGSGKSPYQTSIDLSEPAFKCSCPSRKFPCKHGLGLFLILTQQPGAFTETTPPPWTSEWLAKRLAKDAQKSSSPPRPLSNDEPDNVATQAAAARRAASRDARVSAGLDELDLWLRDLVRTGFATLPGKPASFWEQPAARLVDAQVPGLARRVRDLDGITTTGEGWPSRLLRQISLLHLAREGWSRMASLPAATQADLRATLGFPTHQDEVLAQPGLRDRWLVVGQRIETEDRIRTQRTWLFGRQSQRPALCLSYSAGPHQPLEIRLVPGTTLDAEFAFYPGAWPLRALEKHRFGSPEVAPLSLPHASIADALRFAAEAWTANPWLDCVPFALASVVPVPLGDGWRIRDASQHVLPLDLSDDKAWMLWAISGGHPVSLAGEWNGEALTPIGVWADERFLPV